MNQKTQKGVAGIETVMTYAYFCLSANPTICQNKLDLGFMLENSGRLNGEDNFKRIKSLVKNITDYFMLGPDETRVSVMSFETDSVINISFSQSLDKLRFDSAVDEIKYQDFFGFGLLTLTGEALRKANSDMFSSSYGARGTGRDLVADSNLTVLIMGTYRRTAGKQIEDLFFFLLEDLKRLFVSYQVRHRLREGPILTFEVLNRFSSEHLSSVDWKDLTSRVTSFVYLFLQCYSHRTTSKKTE